MVKFVWPLFFFFSFLSPTIEAGEKYSLSDLEFLACSTDPALKSLYHNLETSLLKYRGADLDFYPAFNLRYTHAPEGGSIEDYEIGTKHWLSMRVNWDILDWFLVKPEQEGIRDTEVRKLEMDIRVRETKVLLDFRKQYLELLEQKIQLDVYTELQSIYQQIIAILKRSVQNTQALPIDVMMVEKELDQINNYIAYFTSNFNKNRKVIADRFQIPEESIVCEKADFPIEKITEDLLVEAGEVQFPDGKYLDIQLDLIEHQENRSVLENVDIQPFVGYRYSENRFEGKQSGLELGISTSVPLSIFHKDNLKSKILAEQKLSYQDQRNALQEKLIQTIREKYQAYQESDILIANAEGDIRILNEKMRLEKIKSGILNIDIKNNTEILRLQEHLVETDRILKLEMLKKRYKHFEMLYWAGLRSEEEMYAIASMKRYPPLSLWVWDEQEILESEKSVQEFKQFCLSNNIRHIFFSINKEILGNESIRNRIAPFIVMLHRFGIQISALVSENSWIFPDKRANLIQHIQNIITLQQSLPEQDRFDGIHFDIEPQALADWRENQKPYLQLLADTYVEIKKYLTDHDASLQIECDVPPSYAQIDPSALRTIIQQCDSVTVMAYETRDVERVLDLSKMVASKGKVHKNQELIVGINAASFQTLNDLHDFIWKIDNHLRPQKKLLSTPIISIHSYSSFHQLKGLE